MKDKYIFNRETLTYEIEKRTFAQFARRSGKFVLVAFGIGVVTWTLSYFNGIAEGQGWGGGIEITEDDCQKIENHESYELH